MQCFPVPFSYPFNYGAPARSILSLTADEAHKPCRCSEQVALNAAITMTNGQMVLLHDHQPTFAAPAAK